jgi:uncharacterized protein YkwD
VVLVGALCLLPAPAAVAATSHTGTTHTRKAHARRRCLGTRGHGVAHKSSHGHAHRASNSHPCAPTKRSSKKRTGHGRHRHHPKTDRGSQAHTPLSISGENCQDTDLMPSEADVVSVREATLCLINRERSHAGEQPLRADGALEESAQGHSTSMAMHGYFEHVSPDGSTPLTRMRESGYLSSSTPTYMVGENIAWGSGSDATPAAIVAAWMASPPHRDNILQGEFRDTGIGVSPHLPSSFAGGQGGAIYTEDFGVKVGS